MSEEARIKFEESDENSTEARKWRYKPYLTSSSENEELDYVGPLVEPDATFIGGLGVERTLKIRAVSRNGGNLDDFLSIPADTPKSHRRKQ